MTPTERDRLEAEECRNKAGWSDKLVDDLINVFEGTAYRDGYFAALLSERKRAVGLVGLLEQAKEIISERAPGYTVWLGEVESALAAYERNGE